MAGNMKLSWKDHKGKWQDGWSEVCRNTLMGSRMEEGWKEYIYLYIRVQ